MSNTINTAALNPTVIAKPMAIATVVVEDSADRAMTTEDDATEFDCASVAACVSFLIGDSDGCPDYGCERC